MKVLFFFFMNCGTVVTMNYDIVCMVWYSMHGGVASINIKHKRN